MNDFLDPNWDKRTEAEKRFDNAYYHAPAYAKKRLLKKMDKRIYRPLEYIASYKYKVSPLTGQMIPILDTAKPHGLFCRHPRAPKDLEQYVKHFTETYYREPKA